MRFDWFGLLRDEKKRIKAKIIIFFYKKDTSIPISYLTRCLYIYIIHNFSASLRFFSKKKELSLHIKFNLKLENKREI